MTKGLEALERLSKNSAFYDNDYKDYQTIKNELKSLKATKEKQEEILRILKRNITIKEGVIDFKQDPDENINTKGNINDFEVIKKWLEEEK